MTNIIAMEPSAEDRRYFGASIRRVSADGQEYYSAREAALFLGYPRWNAFKAVIRRAEKVSPEHFLAVEKVTETRSGIARSMDDVHLSREAFLLVVQNADPHKTMVAHGQIYIARQVAGAAQRGIA